MAGTPYKICDRILRRLDDAGVLPHMVLVGSWAVYFCRYYFTPAAFQPSIRTRDMDFLVNLPPPRLSRNVDIPAELAALDFVIGFRGEDGHMILQHPELALEFLVPERGRGGNKPVRLHQFGVNAQPLRYLDMLLKDTITVRHNGLLIRLPHPARLALHKLLIAGRRHNVAKREKDCREAQKILTALIASDELPAVQAVWRGFPPGWRKSIEKQAAMADLREIVELLKKEKGGKQ